MAKKSFLDSIKSPAPCSKEWNEMNGDERVRFCGDCAKDVYNLSAMTRKEARKFVALNSGKVCVRYVRLPNGKVLTSDPRLYKITRRAALLTAGVFGATLTLSVLSDAQTPTSPKPETNKTVKLQSKNNSQTSQISFTVYDSNGSPIPTAEVKLTNPKTNEEFTALTNDDGAAYLSIIPPGRYEVEISKSNFRNSKRIIQIKEQIEPNIKVYLEVGIFTGVVTIDWYEIPMFQAIAQEDNETVKNLIYAGFNVNTKDGNDYTALHVAVEHGNIEIVRLLLKKGANVNAKTNYKKTPILMLEESFDDEESSTIEILRLLISKGAEVNAQTEEKETVLMMACDGEDFKAVKILLEAGANPNLKDENGETALMKTDSDEIKQLLKQYGAKK